ncbi:transposable element Tc1 transposase [Trichonephila clavipes]|nr:transposable element Tc1 transposase [Trichonephila clavipes]
MRNSFYHTLYSIRQQIHQHNDNKLETMSSMGLLNFYLILIIVLVIVLFVLVLVLIVFRDSFRSLCCCKCEEDSSEEILRHGLRNPAFDDLEFPNRLGALPEQRPFSIMEAMESPPSYEEAVKQELFRFRTPPFPQRQRRQIYRPISAKRNRRTTAQRVANQFLAASRKQISRKTVARRLRGGGIYARRPVVCVPLTRQHRTALLQWCREHHNWTEQYWACVLFSDESRFCLSSDCRRQLIWRESGTAYRPENIQEKDRYPTCSIMVWAGIMINGRTRLYVVANGTMTGQRYIDEVLLPHDCLDSEGIQRLVWPARSPHLNPIENVWYALGRQVAGRNYPPINKNTLIRALTEEWDKLPQQLRAKYGTTCGMLHHTPRWTYPVLIHFSKVPADF